MSIYLFIVVKMKTCRHVRLGSFSGFPSMVQQKFVRSLGWAAHWLSVSVSHETQQSAILCSAALHWYQHLFGVAGDRYWVHEHGDWSEVTVALSFDHQNVISSILRLREWLCQIWRIYIKVFRRYCIDKNGIDNLKTLCLGPQLLLAQRHKSKTGEKRHISHISVIHTVIPLLSSMC